MAKNAIHECRRLKNSRSKYERDTNKRNRANVRYDPNLQIGMSNTSINFIGIFERRSLCERLYFNHSMAQGRETLVRDRVVIGSL
jgi:hypothetical protein